MRLPAALALAVLVAGTAGCTAIDPFNFQFGDLRQTDGGGDGGSADMVPGPGAAFGEACIVGDGGCMQYAAVGVRSTSCFTQFGNATLPGNMCSRNCDDTIITSCTDYAGYKYGALCIPPQSGGGGSDALCMQRCNPTLGFNCRTGYGCCNNQGKTTMEGVCVPGCN